MDPVAAERAQTFYATIRNWIVWIVLFGVLYGWSHILLSRYVNWLKKKNSKKEKYKDKDDDGIGTIPFMICVLSGSFAIGLFSLPSSTIWARFVMASWPHSYYTQWLSPEFVDMAWNLFYFAAHSAVIGFLPFAYFFNESGGGGLAAGSTIWKRILEATITLFLVVVLVWGLVGIIGTVAIWTDNDTDTGNESNSNSSALLSIDGVWRISGLLIHLTTAIGCTISLFAIPTGINVLLRMFKAGATPQRRFSERAIAARLEEDALVLKRDSLIGIQQQQHEKKERERERENGSQRAISRRKRQPESPVVPTLSMEEFGDVVNGSGSVLLDENMNTKESTDKSSPVSSPVPYMQGMNGNSNDNNNDDSLFGRIRSLDRQIEVARSKREGIETEAGGRLPRVGVRVLYALSVIVNGGFIIYLLWNAGWTALLGVSVETVEDVVVVANSIESPPDVYRTLYQSLACAYLAIVTMIGARSFSFGSSDSYSSDPAASFVRLTGVSVILGIAFPCVAFYTGMFTVNNVIKTLLLPQGAIQRVYSVFFIGFVSYRVVFPNKSA